MKEATVVQANGGYIIKLVSQQGTGLVVRNSYKAVVKELEAFFKEEKKDADVPF